MITSPEESIVMVKQSTARLIDRYLSRAIVDDVSVHDPHAKSLRQALTTTSTELQRFQGPAKQKSTDQSLGRDAHVSWHTVYAALSQAEKLIDEARQELYKLG